VTVFRNRFRGNRWRYDFRLGGERFQGYCIDPATGADARTKQQAVECESLIKRTIRREANMARLNIRPGAYSLLQALDQHIASQVESSPLHVRNLELYAREILDFFGHDRLVADIDQPMVDAYRKHAANAKVISWAAGPRKRADMTAEQVAKYTRVTTRKRSAGTTNHHLNCLRAALKVAHRIKDPVSGMPMLPFPPEVKPLPIAKRRAKPMPDAELYSRLATAPPWVKDAAELARHFGLRRAEALRVTRQHIDHENRVLRFPAGENKSGHDESAPPIGGGWELIERLERQAKARGVSHLVTWPGAAHMAALKAGEEVPRDAWRPLKSIRRAWRTSALKAEVAAPHRLHDVRARYITEIARVAPGVAQKAARHSDPVTTQGYIDLVGSEVAEAVRAVPRPSRRVLRAIPGGRKEER